MLTLAQQPYAGLDNSEIFEYIVNSRRILSRPQGYADFWYNTMKHCWRYNLSDRPSFFQIIMRLEPYITEDFKQQSFVLINYEKLNNEYRMDYEFDLTDDDEEEYEGEYEEDEEEEEIEEVDNYDEKEDDKVDDEEYDDKDENKIESDSMLSDHTFQKSKTIGNHLEVIDEDDKSEDDILARPKKHVRISTQNKNAQEQIELMAIENGDRIA